MEPERGGRTKRLLARPWLLAFVPVNAATSGFGVALPLLILLPLAGTWSDVALAASLFNGAVILSSLFWGWVSDRHPGRRRLLLVTYSGFAVIYALLAVVTNLPLLFVLYTAVGVLAPAGTNASNLLILEQFAVAERARAYASLQEMSILGAIGGLLVGYFWLVSGRPLPPLLFVLAGLAAMSVVAVLVGVREGPHVPVATLARTPESLAARLHQTAFRIIVPFFPAWPRLSREAAGRFGTWLRREVRLELPLILLATVLFSLASNLFNISYVPYLANRVGLAASSIFLVNFANGLAQALSFPASGTWTGRLGADRVVQRATYVRSLGYLTVAGFTFVPLVVGEAFTVNAIAFAALGAAIAFYTTSSSMILFRALEGRDAGRLLGLNSALGGLAAVGGAVLSGILSYLGSYRLVFLVSAGALLVSLPLWSWAQVAHARRRFQEVPAPGAPGRPETD